MRKMVLISGRLYTGKTGLANLLVEEFGYYCIKTSEILYEIAKASGLGTDEAELQELADTKDRESGGLWLYEEVVRKMKDLPVGQPAVVDNVRSAEQLEPFRGKSDLEAVHVHLYANSQDLEERHNKNSSSKDGEFPEYDALDHVKLGDIDFLKNDADVRVYTGRTDARDTLVRVAARLGHYSPPNVRSVDVIVGGQYGSEGKGHVAAYLAKEYDYLVRVGGPNAGHSVSAPSGVYTYHQLPSGARDTNAILLLGPGMTINVENMLKEIGDCGVTPDRLYIDPQAMIISEEDRSSEDGLVKKIASTGQGGGAASARRILERDKSTKLARDIPALAPYVGEEPNYRGSITAILEKAYKAGASILLEGTQGSGLSLYHGEYPYVTSRDTNVAGCLAEAGISPSRVRRILMVVRTAPIRVGDPEGVPGATSGTLKHPITLESISKVAGIDLEELKKNERTSTTKRPRKIGWFEWEQFRKACALNAPTDIVLTFADYIHVDNRNARRFEQLTQDTIKFVEELERVAQAPVSLVNTRFMRDEDRLDLRSIIDRRNWRAVRVSQGQDARGME